MELARTELDLDSSNFKTPRSDDRKSADSLLKDAVDSFVQGSGAAQIYNTFAQEKIQLPPIEQAPTFSPRWAVQNVSSIAGSLTSFVLAGKIVGTGMRALGEGVAARGALARVLTNDGAAQVIGAGGFEALKDPNRGETRLGNAVGTMAGFSVFAGGNQLLARSVGVQSGALEFAKSAAGHAAIGALGGGVQYDVTNLTNSLVDGRENQSNWQGRLSAMAWGGAFNAALPALQKGADKAIDFSVNSRSFGSGVPVDRFVQSRGIVDPEINALVNENKLARVRQLTGSDIQIKADIKANTVELGVQDGAGKLAHELNHLKLATEAEPAYAKIAEVLKTDPRSAEQQFYSLRENLELSSRQLENRVVGRDVRSQTPDAVARVDSIQDQIAANGKAYKKVWQDEWSKFEKDSSYRPEFEYSTTDRFTVAPKIEPTSPSKLDPTKITDTQLLGGWISPRGEYFPIEFEAGHWNKAKKITGMKEDGDIALENSGWVHLSSRGSSSIGEGKRMTRAQQNTLIDIAHLVSNTPFGSKILSEIR